MIQNDSKWFKMIQMIQNDPKFYIMYKNYNLIQSDRFDLIWSVEISLYSIQI